MNIDLERECRIAFELNTCWNNAEAISKAFLSVEFLETGIHTVFVGKQDHIKKLDSPLRQPQDVNILPSSGIWLTSKGEKNICHLLCFFSSGNLIDIFILLKNILDK